MYKVLISKTINAPIEKVFEVLADHEGYVNFPGVRKAELIPEGTSPRNGVGAVRRLGLGPISIDEEITEYQAPSLLGYRIVKAPLPVDHEFAQVRLQAHGDKTRVEWESVIHNRWPLVGGLLELAVGKQLEMIFKTMLALMNKRLAPR